MAGRKNNDKSGQTAGSYLGIRVTWLSSTRPTFQPQPDRAWQPGGPHPDDMTPEGRMAEVFQILSLGLVWLFEKSVGT